MTILGPDGREANCEPVLRRSTTYQERRNDMWLNALTGVASNAGKTDFQYQNTFLSDWSDLEALFDGDAYAERVCSVFPEEALRQGFQIQTGDPGLDEAITHKLEELQFTDRFCRAWTWARVFGGGAILLGADDGLNVYEQLDESRIQNVHFLTDLDPGELTPEWWYTSANNPKFGTVERYRFSRSGGQSVDTRAVHESRLIVFQGGMNTRTRRVQNRGWGQSVLRRAHDYLMQFCGSFAAVAGLVQECSQGVLEVKDLDKLIAGDRDGYWAKRMKYMDQTRSVANAILVQAGIEKFSRVEVGALEGVANVLKLFLLLLSGATKIPVTILMGQAPAGLNATGDSDIRTFYDRVKTEQTQTLLPNLTRAVRLILLSKNGPTRGILPAKWKITFNSLWQPTPTERADIRLKNSQSDKNWIDSGVLLPEEVAITRFGPGIEDREITIDVSAREAMLEAERTENAGQGIPRGAGRGGKPADIDALSSIVSKVANREIPRETGIALLVSQCELSTTVAESTMGETGRTFWTKPDPSQVVGFDTLQAEHSKLQASHRGVQQYLARVLEKNKAGELVVGSLIQAPPTELTAGEKLAPGDVVPVTDSVLVTETGTIVTVPGQGPEEFKAPPFPQTMPGSQIWVPPPQRGGPGETMTGELMPGGMERSPVTKESPKIGAREQSTVKTDRVEQRGSKWVVLSEAGEVLGTYDTEADANAQLGASG